MAAEKWQNENYLSEANFVPFFSTCFQKEIQERGTLPRQGKKKKMGKNIHEKITNHLVSCGGRMSRWPIGLSNAISFNGAVFMHMYILAVRPPPNIFA